LDEVAANKTPFDGEKLKELLDGFMPILRTHLEDEIQMLLDLSAYDSMKLKEAANDAHERALGDSKPAEELPILLGCQDASFKIDGDPGVMRAKLPWFLPYMTQFIFHWKNRAAWQFLPSTYHYQRRPLPYATITAKA